MGTLIRHGFAVPPSPLEGEGIRAQFLAKPHRPNSGGGRKPAPALIPTHREEFSP